MIKSLWYNFNKKVGKEISHRVFLYIEISYYSFYYGEFVFVNADRITFFNVLYQNQFKNVSTISKVYCHNKICTQFQWLS